MTGKGDYRLLHLEQITFEDYIYTLIFSEELYRNKSVYSK